MNDSLVVNGKTRTFAEGDFPTTISSLLKIMELSSEAMVAEVNGMIVPRGQFDSHPLAPSCQIELVQFVGGG